VHLVRDLLDKAVVDRNGRELGRVDSIVLEAGPGSAPTVSAIEIGPSVLAWRVLPAFGRWVRALEYAFGVAADRPVRIPLAKVLGVNEHVKVDLAFGETAASVIEQRLRRWVRSIPGA
jgi:sporulation protein YlmC with PRC-barrel domain